MATGREIQPLPKPEADLVEGSRRNLSSSDISRGSPNPTRRQGVREPGEAVPWGEERSEDGGSVREPPVQPEGAGDKQWWLTKMRKCSGSLGRPCVQE